MINVYAWPPVAVTESEWTIEAPVQKSVSILTGKEYVSAYARRRRLATLTVSALALDRAGAGYVEILKRFLDGGVHAVRLYSQPINWWLDAEERGLLQFTGNIVAAGDGVRVDATGLPPAQLVARAGDFVTIGGKPSQVIKNVISSESGTATIMLFDKLPINTDATGIIGGSDTGVFRPTSIPRATQPVEGNWAYTWQFREIFEDEAGGFTEVDPWS